MYWRTVEGGNVLQGAYLPACPFPDVPPDFLEAHAEPINVPVVNRDAIVITQSCDLENGKARHVALCEAYTIENYENATGDQLSANFLNDVRKGNRFAFHMLAPLEGPPGGRQTIIVNFSLVTSLPVAVIRAFAESVGPRKELESPYLEHFSQAFARFFMRVGLPGNLPVF